MLFHVTYSLFVHLSPLSPNLVGRDVFRLWRDRRTGVSVTVTSPTFRHEFLQEYTVRKAETTTNQELQTSSFTWRTRFFALISHFLCSRSWRTDFRLWTSTSSAPPSQKIDFSKSRCHTTETCPLRTPENFLSYDVLTFLNFDRLSVELEKFPLWDRWSTVPPPMSPHSNIHDPRSPRSDKIHARDYHRWKAKNKLFLAMYSLFWVTLAVLLQPVGRPDFRLWSDRIDFSP